MTWRHRIANAAFLVAGLALLSYALYPCLGFWRFLALYIGAYVVYLVWKDEA